MVLGLQNRSESHQHGRLAALESYLPKHGRSLFVSLFGRNQFAPVEEHATQIAKGGGFAAPIADVAERL
jgi:hypothetical protein